ncbi:MAG: transcriptional regulator [Euryarchaeota archaeon]|nr:transcriptional regulator [Euryarchaeota archaeon]
MSQPNAPLALDEILHSPPRIAIASRLVFHGSLRFARLREATGLTAGNLASHLDSLTRAGYVEQRDGFVLKRRGKIVTLTAQGRAAFDRYVSQLEGLVKELKASSPATH